MTVLRDDSWRGSSWHGRLCHCRHQAMGGGDDFVNVADLDDAKRTFVRMYDPAKVMVGPLNWEVNLI